MAESGGSPRADGPPAEAREQPDGSYVQELEDGSSLRWERRADGSWQKPEGRRSGRSPASPGGRRGQRGLESAPGPGSGAAASSKPPGKKHPLHRPWSLYVGPRSADNGTYWSEKHVLVHEFDTVEDFWCMYHHSHPPSAVDNVDYLLFKKDADDSSTSYYKGGRWVISLEEVSKFDDAWLGSILGIIGETFEDVGAEDVVHGVGLSVNRRRGCKVELWITEPVDEDQVLAIGRHYQSIVADYPGLWEKAAQVMEFEDFAKRKVVVQLVGPKAFKSTAGIFQ